MKIPLLDKFLKRGEEIPEKIFKAKPIGAKDIIAPASIEVTQTHLKIGERLAKSFFVFSYPRYLSTAWLSPVINLDVPMDVSMFIHPVESKQILKKLRKRVAEVQSEIIEREEKGLVRDPQLETAYKDLENLRDKLQTAREKMFQFSLYVTIYGDSERDLEDIETSLRSILEARLIYPKPALFQQQQGFISSVPYGLDKLGVTTAMNTAPLSSVFPFISFDLSSNEGILYGVNQHNNSLILFDRFSLENGNSVIFGKAGSGKTTAPSTPVIIKDKNGQVKKEKIGKVVEDLIKEQGVVPVDEESEGVRNPGIEVYSFNKELKGEWTKVKVAARKKPPKTLYKFKTQSGREITTTGDHNMVILKDGKVRVAKSSEIKEGEFVPLPRDIPEPSQTIGSFEGFSFSPELFEILGFYTSEGGTKKTNIEISNTDPATLNYLQSILKKLKINWSFITNKEKIKGIRVLSKEIVKLLQDTKSVGDAGTKRVPNILWQSQSKFVASYLSAYFEGDGTVDKDNKEVTASSKSKKLIYDIAYLLLRFGIIGRIRKKFKKATNSNHKGDYYYQIVISGKENLSRFKKEIGFVTKEKKKKLQKFSKRDGNTNVDIIPELDSTFEEIQDLFAPLLYNIPAAHEWKRRKRRPSPQHLKRVINKIRNRIEDFKDLEHQFKILSELPELNTIIELGKDNKDLNSELWKELGHSWRLMKNKEVQPKSKNAFKAIKVVNGNRYSLKELKEKIHFGFKEIDLCLNHYNHSLQSALVARPRSNTRYQMIQEAAQHVWENYQDILQNKIPQIEEKLNQLEILANSELFWDPIVEIKKIKNKEEKYVYDLEVDNEVFLAGHGGLFIHNSYFQKLEILRSLMMGIDTIVLDPENEYEFLSDAVGGSYFKMSLTSPHHINPFDLPPPREDERPEDILRSNIINLVGLMRLMLGGLSSEEDAIMDRALTETYRARDITPETDPSLWPERAPLMEDLEAVLETMEGAESLLRRLRKFTRGSYAGFFNQPSNISMKNKFVAFGIRDMEEELRPMAMFIIMRHLWNTIRAKLKKRILVIDEAWWLMKNEDGASFLYGTAKRARKYWLGVSTITQDVIDFMKSTYGKPIITNSSLQLLMKQSPAGVELVQKTFNLTGAEKNLLLEAPVGEGLFFAGPKHVAIRVVASYTEDQVITTAPEEVKKIRRAKREISGKKRPSSRF